MRYMLLIYAAPGTGPADGSPEQAAEMKEWYSYTQELVDAGAMISGEALHGAEAATTVRVREGETVVTDGPFAETKEVLGGFYAIEAENVDAALEWAAKVPAAPYGAIEVRPIMELPPAE
jgi:hypothetical protein